MQQRPYRHDGFRVWRIGRGFYQDAQRCRRVSRRGRRSHIVARDAWPDGPTAGQILERIRRESRSEHEKGRWFENLVVRLIRGEPEFEAEGVYRWTDWPERKRLTGLDGKDIGIDLVVSLKSGEWVAVQCKCYDDEKYRVEKKDIDSFLAVSGRDPFGFRWIVATCGWSANAEAEIGGQKIPVSRIDFQKYARVRVDASSPRTRPNRDIWPAQEDAVRSVTDGLLAYDRGQLVMACGTGKTFTSLRISERHVKTGGGRILFLAPSIALVSQARTEWLRHCTRPMRTLLVCSDSTAGRGSDEDIGISELACRVTTDPEKIAQELKSGLDGSATTAVFCTYQSLYQVSRAQRDYGAPAFDLTIADEAHRTTGVDRGGSADGGAGRGKRRDSYFQMVHDPEILITKKRLYMTATPRLYTAQSKTALHSRGYAVVDMDDYSAYGPVFYRLSFKDAVNAGMLSDYRVIIMGTSESDVSADLHRLVALVARGETSDKKQHVFTLSDVTRLLGAALAINGITKGSDEDRPKILARTIGYANSISRSRTFAQAMQLPELYDSIAKRKARDEAAAADLATTSHPITKPDVKHLDASSSAIERNRELLSLEQATPASPRMLCNVRLFTEGVDVPSLDAVIFLDPRDSQVDVVQAVGRVMRSAAGKRFGYIIIPVSVPAGGGLLDALESGSDGYETVGRVLRALQSHDGRLSETPLRFVRVVGPGASPGRGPDALPPDPGIQTILGLEDVSEKFYTKVVAASGLGNPGLLTSQSIEYAVRHAAGIFERTGLGERIAGALELVYEDKNADGKNVCTVSALLVTNACLLHRRLVDVPHMTGLASLNSVGKSRDPGGLLQGAWYSILRKDYSPVFEPALRVLQTLPSGTAVDNAVKIMADCANRLADSLSLLGYDHAGPLYHRILGTASSDGAYYTHNVSALMLARLALSEDFTDWDDADAVRKLRIMDPACGTGTLLMASLQTIKSRMGQDADSAAGITLHRTLVEDVLCGLDINRYGIQLAACNLTLGAPTVDYNRMNLMTMRHGPQSDLSVRSGSLEILRITDNKGDTLREFVQPLQNLDYLEAEHVNKTTPTDFPMAGLDLVIMNPPFTDNQKRSRKFSKEVVKRMQSHELAIQREVRNRDRSAGNALTVNSIRTFFTPLADKLLDSKRGTLAMVLPVTACTSASGTSERKFLAERFHIECIITTHDPKRVNFSYATSIHECLMICRRCSDGNSHANDGSSRSNADLRSPTKFFSLRKMPGNASEAIKAADAIVSSGSDAESWGKSYMWPTSRVMSGDWTPVQWYDASLADIILNIIEDSPLLEKIGPRYKIGPAGQMIRGTYDKCSDGDSGSVRIFDSISSKIRSTIYGTPEYSRRPKPGQLKLAAKCWAQRSNLLVAARFRTTNGLLTALWTDQPSIGSGWVPVQTRDEFSSKALAVWWNSTPVRLMLLNRRGKMLTYPSWSLEHLREIKIPKPDNPNWSALKKAYEKTRNTELLPMSRAPEDPARRIIDAAAARVLGVDKSVVYDWSRRLSLEPTITNRHASD